MITLTPNLKIAGATILHGTIIAGRPYRCIRCACGEEFTRMCGVVVTRVAEGRALECNSCVRKRVEKAHRARRIGSAGHVPRSRRTRRQMGLSCQSCAGQSWRRPAGGCPECKRPSAPEARTA